MLPREECLKILDLAPDADKYEIENRYTMLIKRYRGMDDPDSMLHMQQISLAYNILTGRYIEPEPDDPRLETVVFGKSRRQWRNIWHYGRVKFLLSLIGVAVLAYFIYTVATNRPADFQIGFVGVFARSGDVEVNVEDYIKDMFPEFIEVDVLTIPMDLSSIDGPVETGPDGEMTAPVDGNLYNLMMKMLTLLVGDDYEVFVCDQLVFDRYSRQGAFADLSELYAEWEDQLPDGVRPLRRRINEGDVDLTVPIDPSDNDNPELPILGLDVSALRLTQGMGLYSGSQILTIGIRANAPDEAASFLKNWILDYEEMNRRQAEHEATLQTAAD